MAARIDMGLQIDHLPVRSVGIDAPNRWLAAAWRDFCRAPALSLGYGAIFTGLGYLLVLGLHLGGVGSLIPAVIACFFLVGPVLAAGFYDVSRRAEAGQDVSLGQALAAFGRHWAGLSGIGLFLMLAVAAWMQVAFLIFMLFFHSTPPALDNFIYDVLTADQVVPFLLVGALAGGMIAAVVFSITVVSIPLVVDRNLPVLTAMATSVAAVRRNWKVMLGWAATIVLLVGMGMTTFFLGLALALPLAAYGSWHAYRDLVE